MESAVRSEVKSTFGFVRTSDALLDLGTQLLMPPGTVGMRVSCAGAGGPGLGELSQGELPTTGHCCCSCYQVKI